MSSSVAKRVPTGASGLDGQTNMVGTSTKWNSLSLDDALVAAIVEITLTAGDLALGFFRPGAKTSAAISKKTGGSPVTEADHAVNRYLEQRLRGLLPNAAWLSEESVDSSARVGQDLVFIVDPIDGTRGFAAGERAWAVSVSVVYRQHPVIGVVCAPALGETYVAVRDGGAQLNGRDIHCSTRNGLDASALVAGPLSMAGELRGVGLEFDILPKIPSLALRIAKVAAGTLDASLVSANSNDWDLAAADLIVREAGGRLTSLYGRELLYNRVETQHGELIAGSSSILTQITSAIMQARGL
ncbi:Fructose-1,6-bisphosphatase/inositol-1-monophosphatase [Methylovirgula sp. HY1]|nr:Fructose-1,6-bisphosphatase/inositol-1-monophosphatase [Methylovirgula sp. HY1]